MKIRSMDFRNGIVVRIPYDVEASTMAEDFEHDSVFETGGVNGRCVSREHPTRPADTLSRSDAEKEHGTIRLLTLALWNPTPHPRSLSPSDEERGGGEGGARKAVGTSTFPGVRRIHDGLIMHT